MTDKRMTDEWLAEIERRDGIPFLESIIQEGRRPSDAERDRHELIQALKAEREYVEELENEMPSIAGAVGASMYGKRIRELESAHAEADKQFHQIADQRDELQRKLARLVEKITMALDAIDAEPMPLREPATSVAIGRAQVSDELRALLDSTVKDSLTVVETDDD